MNLSQDCLDILLRIKVPKLPISILLDLYLRFGGVVGFVSTNLLINCDRDLCNSHKNAPQLSKAIVINCKRLTQPMDRQIRVQTVFFHVFPTKYVISKGLKGSHWRRSSSRSTSRTLLGIPSDGGAARPSPRHAARHPSVDPPGEETAMSNLSN